MAHVASIPMEVKQRNAAELINELGQESAQWKSRATLAEARLARQAAAVERLTQDNERLAAENATLKQQVAELNLIAGHDGDTEASLRQRVVELERQVAELTAQLEQARREARRQAAPFRRDKGKKNPRRPGRKRGHVGARRAVPDHVDETRQTVLQGCPECGGQLKKVEDHVNYAVELPPVQPMIIRYEWQSGYCPCCRKRQRSRHPEQPSHAQGAAMVALGPRALALAISLKVRHGMAFRRVAELYITVFGLEFTPGALALAMQRLGRRLEATYEALVKALQVSEAVFIDETGWRVLRVTAWLWVFTSRQVTVYVIDHRRSHDVPLQLLGPNYVGIAHHDGFPAYDALPYPNQQTCYQHLLRDLDELAEIKKAGAVRWPRAVATLLREAIRVRKEHGVTQEPAAPDSPAGSVEERLDRLLLADLTDPDNARMERRLMRNREILFTFLHHEAAEATNARAEQQIRPIVAVRKNGACNRSAAGAKATQILASIIATARQQGHTEFEVLQEAVRHSKGHILDRLLAPGKTSRPSTRPRAGPDRGRSHHQTATGPP